MDIIDVVFMIIFILLAVILIPALYVMIKAHIAWLHSKAGQDYVAQQELKRHREKVRWHEYASRTDSFGNPM